jgi:hypothetical protein
VVSISPDSEAVDDAMRGLNAERLARHLTD